MVEPDKVEFEAAKKEDENIRFRTFLKMHAEPVELDRQFATLHKKLFAEMDCSKCRNCCKKYHATIPTDDIAKDAEFLEMTEIEFCNTYLIRDKNEVGFNTKNCPCDFLKDNECILKDNKPLSCKDFPYTDKPNRLESLFGVLEFSSVCPVVYEIVEQLKKMYRFR